jgi:SAM-dependent methyltransferase
MTNFPDRRRHWDGVYASKHSNEVSWYQEKPNVSLEMIEATGLGRDAGIIDVGGGASTLVDHLLKAGYRDLSVLDIADQALEETRRRLGPRAEEVAWLVADVTEWSPERRYDLWHDRAVFHFLTNGDERRNYVATLEKALVPGGHLIISTFATDGPEKCSGLPVMRHDTGSLMFELGAAFRFVEARSETHETPTGRSQAFLYQRYVRQSR